MEVWIAHKTHPRHLPPTEGPDYRTGPHGRVYSTGGQYVLRMCMYMFVYAGVYKGVHACLGQRLTLVSSSATLRLTFWDRVSH